MRTAIFKNVTMTGKQPDTPRDCLEDGTDVAPGQSLLRLQRAVLKLALSFRGKNSRLDELLKRLGMLMKEGRPDGDLQALIDEIVEAIVSDEVVRDPRQVASATLRGLLEQLAMKPAWRDQARALQRRLKELEPNEDLSRYLKEAAEIINAQLRTARTVDDHDPKPQRKIEDNLPLLLAKLTVPPALEAELARLRTRLEQRTSQAALLESIDEAAQAISRALEPSAGTGWHTARAHFATLLGQLTMPMALVPDVAAIRGALDAATCEAEVRQTIPATASLVAKARALLEHEIEELRQFLRSVLARLAEFKGQMEESGLLHSEALRSTADFEHRMASQVEDLRGAVADENDVEAIKRHVQRHLDTIGTGLREFAQREKRRHDEAKSQLSAVVAKIDALEEETRSLRENLAEQRSRSLMDSLTGVLNRVGYEEAVDREYARWLRHGGALCVSFIDVDHFKSVNDKYGHAAGDKVLATVATLIKRSIRLSDILCRYGGEEFVLIMPQTELSGAIQAMEKIRLVVAESNFRYREAPVPITISIGIAEFHLGDEADEVFDRADRAMYLAKELGRNRCCSERDVPFIATANHGGTAPPLD